MEKDFDVTKMSSRGQIVIPLEMREKMNLEEGSKFAVVGMDDTIILKRLEPPRWEDFDETISRMRKYGREKGITEKKINKAVREIRKSA